MDITPRELVAGTVELKSLPEIILRLNELMDDPRSSTSQIAQLIGQDAGLAARLLRLANSPFYGFPSRVDNLARATAIIGTEELRDLILATTVTQRFNGLPSDLVDMNAFWRHNVHNAVVARSLAAKRRERNIERFFLAGLIHDVGALVIYRKLPELARAALTRARFEKLPLHEAEYSVMGFDHAAVGGELMRAWRLPEDIVQALEFHHAPSGAREFPVEAATLHLADIITNAMKEGYEELGASPASQPEAWLRAGLSPDVLEDVIATAKEQFAAAYRLVLGEDSGDSA